MSLFAAAVAAPKAEKKKPAAKTKLEVAIEGMEQFAAFKAVEKAMKAVSGTFEQSIKAQMATLFVKEGMKLGRRPENFEGIEGVASGSCQLKAKSSNQIVTAEELSLLEQHNIPVVTLDTVVETFIINPAYADLTNPMNKALLDKVSKALEGVKGLPADFLQHQSEKKVCVDEASMNAVFALKDEDVVAELLPLVATLAIRPTIESEKVAFEIVGKMLGLSDSPTKKVETK